MSTLSRQRSNGNKIPDYKEYMNFVSAYKNGNKDASYSEKVQEVPAKFNPKPLKSDTQGLEVTSYSNFLEKTKGKEFGSVKPPLTKHQSTADSTGKPARKTVKTEIFLQIDDIYNHTTRDEKTDNNQVERQEQPIKKESIESVSVKAKTKIFENSSIPKTQHVSNIKTENTNTHNLSVRKDENITKYSHSVNKKCYISLCDQNHIETNRTTNKKFSSEENSSKVKSDEPQNKGEINHFYGNEENRNEVLFSNKGKMIEQLDGIFSNSKKGSTNTIEIPREIQENEIVHEKSKGICENTGPPPPPPMPNYSNFNTKTQEINRNGSVSNNPSVPVYSNGSQGDQKQNSVVANKQQKHSTLDRSRDNLVRKLAYGAMLDMYGAYHDKANSYVSTLPRNQVRKENGLQKIIDNIAQEQSRPPATHQRQDKTKSGQSYQPSTTTKMEPPPCIQNAMLTKDKKPFTYTPGGLNLAEIRSPRMARRIERNAAYEGVGTPPPQPNRPNVQPGSLPPSAMAAMQPQMHVQVFPPGPPPPPPMSHSMMAGAPPPPPAPPMGPLPTQKIRTADQQVVERPDMTKIIPENPMALLKKTGGPRVRNTLLEEVYREPPRTAQPQQTIESSSPKQLKSAPQFSNQQQWPVSPPPVQNSPYYQNQQNCQVQPTSPPLAQHQQWSPPIVDRSEPPRSPGQQMQKPNQSEKAVHVGSIYIPPLNNNQQNKSISSPPAPQSPRVSTPGTPTLKEAPKPWQQKQHPKQDEMPEWTKREPATSSDPVFREENSLQNTMNRKQQPTWPSMNQPSPISPLQHNQEDMFRRAPQRFEIPSQKFEQRQQPQQQIFQEIRPDVGAGSHPNAVFVTQPIVLQHPGGGYGPPVINRREYMPPSKQEDAARIIPVRVEEAAPQNQNRGPSRQQSWGNNPPQSGSFRVIQKLTSTDKDDSNFEGEQMRKMQLNDGDQELLNRFKQVPNDCGRNKPQVRNIPIQIEGGSAPYPQSYVPPSQQGPPEEPKKYTGGSIPSRSFKMLQAMTAPDSCANANEANDTNENYDPPYPWGNWGYPPAYFMYHSPPPYWPACYPPNPHEYPPSTEQNNSDAQLNARRNPPPFWGYSPATPIAELEQRDSASSKTPSSFSRCSSTSELENINNARKTPIPYWGCPNPITPGAGRRTPKSEGESNRQTPVPFYLPYPPQGATAENNRREGDYNFYPPYPPYYDPYYFPHYFPYPPMYSPHQFMYPSSESEDVNGYSSMDEMSYYQKSTKSTCAGKTKETLTPEILITPTPEEQNIREEESDEESANSDTDKEEEVPKRSPSSTGLQTIRSVRDINVYKETDEESEQSDEEDSDAASSTSSIYEETEEGDEIIPHQLSVIFEVSERTEISRNARECSVVSDCTTLGAKSDDEDDSDFKRNKLWISDNLMEIASRIQNRINARIELDESELHSAFTLNYQSPKSIYNTEWSQSSNQCQKKAEEIKHEDISSLSVNDSCYSHEPVEAEKEREVNMEHIADKDQGVTGELNSEEIENCITEEVAQNSSKIEELPEKLEEIESTSKESSDSEDWWGVIGKEDDNVPLRKVSTYERKTTDYEVETKREQDSDTLEEIPSNSPKEIPDDLAKEETERESLRESENEDVNIFIELQREEEDAQKLETTSAHSNHSSASSRKVSNADSAPEIYSDESSSSDGEESDSSCDGDEEKHDINNNEEKSEEETVVRMPSIKDRIRALQESISAKKKSLALREEEIKMCVKVKVTASSDIEEATKNKVGSAKSSVKSFDEISEEDSGVTDMSRQFSDNEEYSELKKMSKYQRASTHSRLFELLQEECENEEEPGMEERKNQLTLPLNTGVSDKLVDELVQSMLKQRKGQIFRNMSMERLHAAAKRILQEDNGNYDNSDTPSDGFSELLSPLRYDTGNSTPQEFYSHYNEYMQYYDSWAQAASHQSNYDSFKPNQDSPRSAGFFTSIAKCPRVLSGKNLHSDLKKLVECPEEPSSLAAEIPPTKS